MHKIPVTVVTGFLGAGKTTLVRNLLKNNQGRRIAVLVNEFGEVGIDGELLRSCQVCDKDEGPASTDSNILELANGCLCCTVQEEFLPTMQELLKRRDRLDCIVVETSGLALPKPLVQAFRWPEIRTGATVDGVVTVVDCEALAAGQVVGDIDALMAQRDEDPNLEHETPIEELFEDQLGCADMVLLTKVDQVQAGDRDRVLGWLQNEVPKGVKIVPCEQGQIAPEVLLGFNAAVEDDLDNRHSHHDHEEEHDHDDNITAIDVELSPVVDPKTLVKKLQRLVEDWEIYRIKGFVDVADKPMRLVLQGVGNRFDTFFDRPWAANDTRRTQLVIIGQDLNADDIRQAIA